MTRRKVYLVVNIVNNNIPSATFDKKQAVSTKNYLTRSFGSIYAVLEATVLEDKSIFEPML